MKICLACKNCADYHKNEGCCSGSNIPCEPEYYKTVKNQSTLEEFEGA